MRPQAIIFDLDGTLIDTEKLWDEVRRGLASEAGVAWPEEATQAMMGMSTPEWGRYLSESVGLPMTPEEAAHTTIELMAERYHHGLPLLPGSPDVVHQMAEHFRIAVASSSPRRLIDVVVEELGIADVVEVSVSTEEVERGKPAPDGFLRAAELLGVPAADCVAVEDSTNGVKSALAAGMTVITVPPHFHPPAAELLAQTKVLDSLEELSLAVIESL